MSTGFRPFQVVYSIVPCGPLDLIPLSSKTLVHGKAKEFVRWVCRRFTKEFMII